MRKMLTGVVLLGVMLFAGSSFAYQAGDLIWSYQGPDDHCVCVMGFSDVDGDSHPDVVGIWGNSAYQGDHNLFCLSGPGNNGSPVVLWSAGPQGGVSSGGGYGDDCLSRYTDDDGDGIDEVLLGTAWGGRSAFLINGADGSTEWVYDTYVHEPSGWCYSIHMTGDLNFDGIPDVLAGFGSYQDAAVALSGVDGSLIWKFQANDAVFAVSSIGSINYDDAPEAIIGAGDPYEDRVICVDGATGTLIWEYHTGQSVWDVEGFVDVDGDGLQDVLAGSWSENVYCLSAANGDLIWQSNIGTSVMEVKVGGDQNGDGIPEALVASWDNRIISLDGATGAVNWSTTVGDLNGGDVWTIDNVPDVTQDGIDEVVGGSFDYNVYLCDGSDGSILWQYNTGNRLKTVRAAGDLDGDGNCDIIAGTQYLSSGGKMFAISGGSMPDIYIDMIPAEDPVVVTPGGSFQYTGVLINNTADVQVTDVWIMLDVPDYGIYGPIQEMDHIIMLPHDTLTAAMTQHIPGYAPLGDYNYIAYCGDYPDSVISSASFPFTVIEGAGGNSADWDVVGLDKWNENHDIKLPDDNSNASHPVEFALHGNYPNPFNAATNINFSLVYGGEVDLTVYNIAGREVAKLVDGYLSAGTHSIRWNAADMPSGIYYAKLTNLGKTSIKKMTLVK